MKIIFIIPVYNRPEEAGQALESLAGQSDGNFGVVVVEDGSTRDCRAVATQFEGRLRISYLVKPNGGPASARNWGVAHSEADFFIFLDSDVIVPGDYMATVRRAVEGGAEFFGGPDMAEATFSPMQRAVSYSMTSFFTTGGIRGGRRSMERFTPRSFNMGVSSRLFHLVGGFGEMRYGEDIDFSLKVREAGVEGMLLREAGVFHRRRTDMRSFFRQVWHSGAARVELARRHPGSLRTVHLLPMAFVAGSAACLLLMAVRWWTIAPVAAVCLVWLADSSLRNHSVRVGLLSVPTSMVQLWGYGTGMIAGLWRMLLNRL